MSFAESQAARQRGKRLVLIALAFAVLAALLAGVARWASSPALSEAERALVGTWTYQWDGSLSEPPLLEYEYYPDGRCVIRYFDPGTGTYTNGAGRLTWKLRGAELVVRHPNGAPRRFWNVFGLDQYVDEIQTLTPDGPNHFRYKGTIRGRYVPSHNALTGVMTRVVLPP